MKQPEKTKPFCDRQRHVTIAVVALFALACLGRIVAPEVALFRELLPIVAALLGLVVKETLGGRAGSS